MMTGSNRQLRKQARRCALILALMLLFSVCAVAESDDYWICPECTRGGNTGNFCTNCGAARPVSEENDQLTQIPGETDRVMVDILRIDGSGFVRDSKKKSLYEPARAIDEDETTCWQVAVKKGQKNKPWLAMIIDEQTVDEIWIKNGFRKLSSKGKDQYPLYARMKEIRVEIYYDENKSDELTFTLADENNGEWEKLDVGRHEKVYDVWVYIQSVYNGRSKKNNVCLSEIMLVQKAPAETAKPGWR